MKLTAVEKDVLTAAYIISYDGKNPDPETYARFRSYYFRRENPDWNDAVTALVGKNLLVPVNDSVYLTRKGSERTGPIMRDIGFSNMLRKCEKSGAYGRFCQEVYGRDLCQFDMMDMGQLDCLVQTLKLSDQNQVLELGCGIGTIAEYISDVTGVHITGLDLASGAIERARERTLSKSDRLVFMEGNMDGLDFPVGSFDTLIAIDTLYFVKDLKATVAKMKAILKPGGQMGLFYSSMAQSEGSRDELHPDKSRLAHALNDQELNYQTIDFTQSETEIWRKTMTCMETLKPEFEEENNFDMYTRRISEGEIVMKYVDSGRMSRFLYHVQM